MSENKPFKKGDFDDCSPRNQRFEFITDCNNNTLLIDNRNKLPALPLSVDYDSLIIEDWNMLDRWLKYLNGE